ncbi:putative ELL complex subunit Eap30 [Venturia nashicola]|uniref:Vacuolar-sorting protein SNF8 n=1 Tax=Venturia nashicola TaxID=86259 RepID=A0A4Z1P9S5_9PEZI|nr:putative ELL complex subunit Eap30 [Venturia nashicola]TLD37221.1 putative ELL complex subunit Eap30 [Venturia nashicola]
MARRGVGLSAFSNEAINNAYASRGTSIRAAHDESLETQLSVFQQLLHQFSITHGKEIRSDPTFRAEFARMCNAIGVDPLASSHKSKEGGKSGNVWAQIMGGSVNDFYFELAVRVVEVCRETRAENGGMMAAAEVKSRVQKGGGVGGGMEVSDDDIRRAVKSLEPLGSGFKIIDLGANQMIRSVPKELNTDQSTVLEVVQVLGYVTISVLRDNLGWEKARAAAVIEDLVADSLVWVDIQAEETEYWTPSFIHQVEGA